MYCENHRKSARRLYHGTYFTGKHKNALSEALCINPRPLGQTISRYVAMAVRTLLPAVTICLRLCLSAGTFARYRARTPVSLQKDIFLMVIVTVWNGAGKGGPDLYLHAFMIRTLKAPSGHSMSARQITSS